MAMSKSATKLEDILQCAICLEVLTEPVTFQCFHSFCTKCTQTFRTQTVNGDDVYICPVCRRHSSKDQLQRTHLLSNLLELRQLYLYEQRICCKCKRQDSTWRCLECVAIFCDVCKQDHVFYEHLKQHNLISLADHAHALNATKTMYCDTHQDKMLHHIGKIAGVKYMTVIHRRPAAASNKLAGRELTKTKLIAAFPIARHRIGASRSRPHPMPWQPSRPSVHAPTPPHQLH